MPELYTTGVWRPKPGREDAFVTAWTEFARWASGMPGAGTLRLARDAGDRGRFMSLARWQDAAAVRGWEGSPEFRERLGRVLRHVDGFEPAELSVIVTVAHDAAAVATK